MKWQFWKKQKTEEQIFFENFIKESKNRNKFIGLKDNYDKYKSNWFYENKELFILNLFIAILGFVWYFSSNTSFDLVPQFNFQLNHLADGLFVNLLSTLIVIFGYDIFRQRRENLQRKQKLSLQFSVLHELVEKQYSNLLIEKYIKIISAEERMEICKLFQKYKFCGGEVERNGAIKLRLISTLIPIYLVLSTKNWYFLDLLLGAELREENEVVINKYINILDNFFNENKDLFTFEEFYLWKKSILIKSDSLISMYKKYLISVVELNKFLFKFEDIDLYWYQNLYSIIWESISLKNLHINLEALNEEKNQIREKIKEKREDTNFEIPIYYEECRKLLNT